jgi:phage I-like protein
MALIGQYALTEAQPEGGSNVSKRVPLMTTTNGVVQNGDKPFEITASDLELYAESIRAQAGRVPFDYDHSFAEKGDSRAAGWIQADTVEVDGDTIYASVEWTPKAAASIRDGEYRFVSPEFDPPARDTEGLVTRAARFVAAALTNRPFLKKLGAVTLSDKTLAELASQLNPFRLIDEAAAARLAEHFDVDPLDIVALAGGIKPRIKQEDDTVDLKAIAGALKLAEDADEATILAAIAKTTTPEPGTVTLTAKDVDTLKASAAKGEQAAKDLHDMKRDTVIANAVRTGRLLPAQKEAFEALYNADPAGTVKLIETTPEKTFSEKGSGGKAVGDGDLEPKTVEVDGASYTVEPATLTLSAAAKAILAKEGKHTYTQDEYLRAVSQAKREQSAA